MEIRNLKETPLSDIVAGITASFADYFVPMSSDVSYWEKRFGAARVDYELSFGMFDNGQLVGFIINGIDELNGLKTAFNTGTGVLAAARGHKVIDQLYAYALPYFRKKSILLCSLEVIQKNERAIHVYERIGFHINKQLRCFKGTLECTDKAIAVQETSWDRIAAQAGPYDPFYSWDNTAAGIRAAGSTYLCYKVRKDSRDIGYFILNPATNHLVQFETATGTAADLSSLLSGIATIAPAIKINNVDGERADVIAVLLDAGLDNFIDQYEMQMTIS